MVPRSVNLTGKRDNAGHEKTTVNKLVITAERLPRLGKRELFFLQSFTCNYVVSVSRGVLFLLVLEIGWVILLWYSLGLPYDYFDAARTHS